MRIAVPKTNNQNLLTVRISSELEDYIEQERQKLGINKTDFVIDKLRSSYLGLNLDESTLKKFAQACAFYELTPQEAIESFVYRLIADSIAKKPYSNSL